MSGASNACLRSPGEARGGFTLIEILVVLSILSLLAGLTMVGVMKAREYGEEKAEAATIAMLKARVESFANVMGDFPPSSFSRIKVAGNGVNEGNESLFAWLLTKKRGGGFADGLEEDRWVNVDGDQLDSKQVREVAKHINWTRGNNQLLEYTDLWGAPYIYIHNEDYGKKLKCQTTAEGGVFEVEARQSPTTGTYFAPTTFQLWSLGPDGVNQNGEGDDIVSWK